MKMTSTIHFACSRGRDVPRITSKAAWVWMLCIFPDIRVLVWLFANYFSHTLETAYYDVVVSLLIGLAAIYFIYSRSQVQLLYDLAAQRGKDTSRSPPRAPVQSSSGNSSTSGNNTGSSVGVDHGFPALKPSEDTLCALKRLSEQAAERMAQAASKTDFKEAALWRNRRDALLSTMHHIEGGIDVAGEEVVFAIG